MKLDPKDLCRLALGCAVLIGALPVAAARDVVFYNGKVLTVDERFSIAQAVAVRDGLILATGSSKDVLRAAGSDAQRIDLQGKTVLPGLIDAHAHMDREGLKYVYPSLKGARSIADVLKFIEAEVKKSKPGKWIVTMPVGDPPDYKGGPDILAEKRMPTRWELDAVSPDNPVYIRGIWGYWDQPPIYSVANSRALALAGITRDTVAPYDGITVERNREGEPTGVFKETNLIPAMEASLMKVAPRFDHQIRLDALRESQRRYNAAGTTSIYEGHGISSEVMAVYKDLWARGELTVRSYLVGSPEPAIATTRHLEERMRDWGVTVSGPGFGDSMLRVGGMFMEIGGYPALSRVLGEDAPYTAWASNYYTPLTRERFKELALLAARDGIRVNAIVNDQKAMDEVLEIFESINEQVDLTGRRWVVEHIGQMNAGNIATVKRLGLVATTNPANIWKSGARRIQRVPADLRGDFAPYKSIMEAGIPLAIATDNVPIRPFFIMWATLARSDRGTGEVLVAEQRLSREQALKAMTINGAFLTFDEKHKGSIEKGKYADLVVIEQDYLTMPEQDIKDIQPLMTMVGGRVVHVDKTFSAGALLQPAIIPIH